MDDDERAIRTLIDTWMEATRDGDTDAVLGLMSDDVVFLVPGQEPFGKEAFRAMSRQMQDLRIDATHEILELQVVAPWAFMRARLKMTLTGGDTPALHKAGHTLTILHKQADGRWRLARDANLVGARK